MELLKEVVILFATATASLFLCRLAKVPSLLGFLVAGMVAGPQGLGLVEEQQGVEVLAEVGVSLLLFTVGMEFSQESLARIQRAMLLGGSLQVGGTVAVCLALGHWAGLDIPRALVAGMLVALSSTAIVIRSLLERAELASPHGQNALGILVFQDLMIVPMMLALSVLGAAGDSTEGTPALQALRGMLLVIAVTLAAWKAVPGLLLAVAKARSREMFLLSILGICFFMTWFAHVNGLSPAIGALLAGLVISRSEFSHEALGNVLPFRDALMSLFFVSIGMLMDLKFLVREPLMILVGVAALVVIKASVGFGTGLVLRLPLRTVIMLAAALSQVGELSFVIAQSAYSKGLVSEVLYQGFLVLSVVSMGMTPVLIRWGRVLAQRAARWDGWPKWLLGVEGATEANSGISGHLIIVGFGLNGRNLARAANAAGIPYVVVEMNPRTVRAERAKGEAILYGDASLEPVLEAAGIESARCLVVVINDPGAVRGIVRLGRRRNPGVHIIVRTRYVEEVDSLYRLGADEVIPEEFETSIEIFTRVLRRYLVPEEELERMVSEIRAEGYEMLRRQSSSRPSVCDLGSLEVGLEVRSLRVGPGALACGRSLSELDLRRAYGATVVAVVRGGEFIVDPDPSQPIQEGDVLVVLGRAERIPRVLHLLGGVAREKVG